jgi:hypothetical protein
VARGLPLTLLVATLAGVAWGQGAWLAAAALGASLLVLVAATLRACGAAQAAVLHALHELRVRAQAASETTPAVLARPDLALPHA